MNQVQIVQNVVEVVSGRKVAGPIRSLMNVRNFQLEYAMMLHELLLLPVLLYGNETKSIGLGLCRWTTLEVR